MYFPVGLPTQHSLRIPRAQPRNQPPGMLQGPEHPREAPPVVRRLVGTVHEVLLVVLVEADCLEAEELECGKEAIGWSFVWLKST
jgi:hypothetical protein